MNEKKPNIKSLSHPVRVQILFLLSQDPNGKTFSDLSRELQIESSGKLAFHLEKLKDFIKKGDEGKYVLTEEGYKAVQALQLLGVDTENGSKINADNHKPPVVEPPEGRSETTFTSSEKQITFNNRQNRLGAKQVSIYGGLVGIFFGIVLPIIIFLILPSIIKSSNDTGYSSTSTVSVLVLFMLFVFAGNVLTGYITEHVIITKGNTETKTDSGLIFLFITSAEFIIFPVFIVSKNASVGLSFLVVVYFAIVIGAWLKHTMTTETQETLKLFPSGFKDNITKYSLILLTILSINLFTTQFSYTKWISNSGYETHKYSFYSSGIGMSGFIGIVVHTLILMFVYTKNNSIKVEKSLPSLKFIIISLVLSLFLNPITTGLTVAMISMAPHLQLTDQIVLTVLTLVSMLFFVWGGLVAKRIYYYHQQTGIN